MGSASFHHSIQISNLSVARAGKLILCGVSADLAPGDALILRGANGAGKTSLLRALAGFARVTEGEISIFNGKDEVDFEDAISENLHFLGHENGISTKLTPLENLAFWAKLMPQGSEPSRDDLLTKVGLSLLACEKVHRLSAGQKRRLALARLLIAPRSIWLMDEPATALDTEGQALLLELCAAHRAKGGIIIMTTHGGFTLPNARGLQLGAPGENA